MTRWNGSVMKRERQPGTPRKVVHPPMTQDQTTSTRGGRAPKIAGAPISWGVCEVPGWGPMLEAERVLREVTSLGLNAIELGAPGFLPADVGELTGLLDRHNVRLVGGFVPVVLHDPSLRDATLREATKTAALFERAGVGSFVSAVVVDAGWAPRYALSDTEWQHLYRMLGELDRIAAEHGLQHVVHPHVNTLIETSDDVQRVLDNTTVRWCLDTGHLSIGGFDPVEFAKDYGDRVGHVHLKDVTDAVADRLRSGELTLMQATQAGMFRSLGEGDVDLAAVLAELGRHGYDGWYVLEQDTSIDGEPPVEGCGPVEDVAVSLRFLRKHLRTTES
jgi:inosose dehydratase